MVEKLYLLYHNISFMKLKVLEIICIIYSAITVLAFLAFYVIAVYIICTRIL